MINTEDIFNKIVSKNPISIIRVGDGEAMVLNALKDPRSYARVIKRQLGEGVTFEDGLNIRDNLIKALSECDVIGIPDEKKKAKEPDSYWQRAPQILMDNVNIEGKEIANIDLHYHLSDANLYPEIFKHFDRVFYISCRTVNLNKYIAHVDNYVIAPEKIFTTYEGPAHYPDQFVKIENWMDKRPIKGALCLVGAGVVGKIYCNWFRDRGGIALDIGSVFDQWAGHVTRGPGRGKDIKTNENTL